MDKKELELAGGKLEKISGSKSTVLVLGGHVRRTCGAVNLINQSWSENNVADLLLSIQI